MHSLAQLEKQQVGLRLHKYLVDEIDEFTKEYSVNRTDIIVEAIKSYISEQKQKEFYKNFDQSCKEVKMMMDGDIKENSLQDFIDEYRESTNTYIFKNIQKAFKKV